MVTGENTQLYLFDIIEKNNGVEETSVLFRLNNSDQSDYHISQPHGHDIYNAEKEYSKENHTSLPPLLASPRPTDENNGSHSSRRKKSSRAQSVLYPYIHGYTRTVESAYRGSTARSISALSKSKDDSRIQYEMPIEDSTRSKRKISAFSHPGPWKARKVRFYRNGDRFYPGYEYTFKPGRDVLNMEGLCDKLSDRIDLARGARYIFTLDGKRIYRIEELEDGKSYVAASDKKFVMLPYGTMTRPDWNPPSRSSSAISIRSFNDMPNLAYGKPRPDWNSTVQNTGSMKEIEGKIKRNSSDSNRSSSNSQPGSREGRTIKIINSLDKSQERSVLVNMKTIQTWEDIVGDLAQVLKIKGTPVLMSSTGDEVKSFSQFKTDFANSDTFYLNTSDKKEESRGSLPTNESSSRKSSISDGYQDSSKKHENSSTNKLSKKPTLRRHTSEPTLKETPEEREDSEEVADGRSATIKIRGQTRTFHSPTKPVTHNPLPPENTLTLDWVYGYRGSDTKKNLWVLPSGELLYYVAAVAILYDRDTDTQKHYTEHSEDIQCMTIHPSKNIVASGQRASRGQRTTAHVRIWDTQSRTTLHVLGLKELSVGILAVGFSKKNNGEFLLAIDADKEHLLSVWTWQTEQVLGRVATHHDHVWGAVFHPQDDNLIISFGRGLLALWSRRKDGIFQRSDLITEESKRTIQCAEFTFDGDMVTGEIDGKMTVWSVNPDGEHYTKHEIQAHQGPINSLQLLAEGTILSGGDKDRKVIAWDCEEEFEKIAETKLPDQAGGIRTIYPQHVDVHDGNIYIGTVKNMILEGSLQRRFNQVVFGHSKQLWGLAVNHVEGSVATAGYDKHIVKWSGNKLEWRIQAQSECVSVAVHPLGTVIVAGTIDGHLIILNSASGLHVATIRVCGSPLSALSYNENGDILAIGSQNGSLYLFRSSKDGFVYHRYGRMGGSQPLSGIDWSISENFLQSVTSEYDTAYWNLKDLSKVKDAIEVRNEVWATQTCPLGYTINGIWGGKKDSPIQVTVDKGPTGEILAAGDTDGYIRLYRFPVLSSRAGYHEYKMYTSYVSAIRFSKIENYLYTIGDTDAALMRWKIS